MSIPFSGDWPADEPAVDVYCLLEPPQGRPEAIRREAVVIQLLLEMLDTHAREVSVQRAIIVDIVRVRVSCSVSALRHHLYFTVSHNTFLSTHTKSESAILPR